MLSTISVGGKPVDNPLADDLGHILAHTADLWDRLRGQRIFITGGTGFFGCWLLESFAWANDTLNLGAEAIVLSRSPEAFAKKAPHLASNPAIQFHTGDIRSFDFPPGEFSHVIHAATEASAKLNAEDPLLMLDTIVDGTRRVLEFARHCGAGKFLFVSSGAVYGKQPSDLPRIPEDYAGSPDTMDPLSAYGQGKRLAEHLCALYNRQYKIQTKIARAFAFVGPYLPLDAHFAIGNFIRDGLRGDPIRVNGDGTPYRSYLYAADLAIWLWTIFFRGKSSCAYNVGSEQETTIAQLAKTVADSFGPELSVDIEKKAPPGVIPTKYVPSTQKSLRTLQLRETFGLQDSIDRTVQWHRLEANPLRG